MSSLILVSAIWLSGLITHNTVLEVRPSTKVVSEVLADGQTVVWVFSPTETPILPQFLSQDPPFSNATGHAVAGSLHEVYLRFERPVVASRIERRNRTLLLQVQCESPVEAIRARISKALPRTVPSSFLAPQLRRAETHLSAGRLQAAQQAYAKLAETEGLRYWVALRLADLSLLRGSSVVACHNYATLYEQTPGRSTGLLAWLRMLALHCSSAEFSPSVWDKTIKKVSQLSSRVGEFLWSELTWTLARVQEAEEIQYVLQKFSEAGLAERLTRERLSASLMPTLAARTFYLEERPLHRLAALEQHASLLMSSKKRRGMILDAVRLLDGFDLWQEVLRWVRLPRSPRKDVAASSWQARRGDSQLKLHEVNAFTQLGLHRDAARATSLLPQPWQAHLKGSASTSVSVSTFEDQVSELREIRSRFELLREVNAVLSKGGLNRE